MPAIAVGLPVAGAGVPDVESQGDVFVAAPCAAEVADAEISADVAEGLQVVVELEDHGGSIRGHGARAPSEEEVELDLDALFAQVELLGEPDPGALVALGLGEGEDLVAAAAVIDNLDAAIAL